MAQELKVCGRTDCTYPFAYVLLAQKDNEWVALGICLDHYEDATKTYNVVEKYEAKLFWSEKRWDKFLTAQTKRLERKEHG